ncbi:MAG TPA: cyclic nucleotide-binding domain-containing protein [Burkholderiales bacterium]|nr:cyclic nucleotide-binding domain-containing protein [Burkholderiales bacterium]
MDLKELFRFETELIDVAAGKPLFRTGDAGDRMYVLMDGEADILVGNSVVERAVTGALIGELALLDNSPRTATVQAVSDCRLLPIDVRRFKFLVEQTPNFSFHVMKIMAERLRKMDVRLQDAQKASA